MRRLPFLHQGFYYRIPFSPYVAAQNAIFKSRAFMNWILTTLLPFNVLIKYHKIVLTYLVSSLVSASALSWKKWVFFLSQKCIPCSFDIMANPLVLCTILFMFITCLYIQRLVVTVLSNFPVTLQSLKKYVLIRKISEWLNKWMHFKRKLLMFLLFYWIFQDVWSIPGSLTRIAARCPTSLI